MDGGWWIVKVPVIKLLVVISNSNEIKKKQRKTYLGLKTQCVSSPLLPGWICCGGWHAMVEIGDDGGCVEGVMVVVMVVVALKAVVVTKMMMVVVSWGDVAML